MADLTIAAYQEKVDAWIRTIGVRYFSELTNLAQLVEEVGEVARIMSRVYGDQSFKPTARESEGPSASADAEDLKPTAMLADELADVMFVIACIANQTGVDLTGALMDNLEKKTRRDADRHRTNPKLRR